MRILVTTLSSAFVAFVVLWQLQSDTQQSDVADAAEQSEAASVDPIADLERYDDPDYGFSLAVPVGWTRIVAADTDDVADVLASLEPGYAVGFESPRSGDSDIFADYILIEVLPGNEFGLFEATEAQRRYIEIDAQPVAYDRLLVDSAVDANAAVDLVIFQRGVQAFGYTLAFYAIGEPDNEQTLFDAFQIMLHTFSQTTEPFVVI